MSQSGKPSDPPSASPWRAWWYLVVFSFVRMFRVRQLVAIATALLLITVVIVALVTLQFGWDRSAARLARANPDRIMLVAGGVVAPVIEKSEYMQSIRKESQPLPVFSRWMVFFVFLGFLMPLWTLSFAVSGLGTERESRSMVWLMTRPIPREGIYLAKFLAVLPWCLGFSLIGFAAICFCAGGTGRQAFVLFWPAVLAGTATFTALFHLIGAVLPRPAIVGLVYAFFFETILSELPVPGTVKRLSINYYTRCIMYADAESAGIPTESSALFIPVSTELAWLVLLGAMVVITGLGMWLFGRIEPREES